MSIQQSMNQLLSSAALGSAIFMHTPWAKEQLEVQGLKRSIKQADAISERQIEESDYPTSTEGREAAKVASEQAQRLATLRPTKEHLQDAAAARGYRDTIEELVEEEEQTKKDKAAAEQRKREAKRQAEQIILEDTPTTQPHVRTPEEQAEMLSYIQTDEPEMTEEVQGEELPLPEPLVRLNADIVNRRNQQQGMDERAFLLRLREQGIISGRQKNHIEYELNKQKGGNQ